VLLQMIDGMRVSDLGPFRAIGPDLFALDMAEMASGWTAGMTAEFS
jgi:hypothetical protein